MEALFLEILKVSMICGGGILLFIHYKRKDLWTKSILAFAKILHWFNPLVFWMERQACYF